jgi:hypothetical protein
LNAATGLFAHRGFIQQGINFVKIRDAFVRRPFWRIGPIHFPPRLVRGGTKIGLAHGPIKPRECPWANALFGKTRVPIAAGWLKGYFKRYFATASPRE